MASFTVTVSSPGNMHTQVQDALNRGDSPIYIPRGVTIPGPFTVTKNSAIIGGGKDSGGSIFQESPSGNNDPIFTVAPGVVFNLISSQVNNSGLYRGIVAIQATTGAQIYITDSLVVGFGDGYAKGVLDGPSTSTAFLSGSRIQNDSGGTSTTSPLNTGGIVIKNTTDTFIVTNGGVLENVSASELTNSNLVGTTAFTITSGNVVTVSSPAAPLLIANGGVISNITATVSAVAPAASGNAAQSIANSTFTVPAPGTGRVELAASQNISNVDILAYYSQLSAPVIEHVRDTNTATGVPNNSVLTNGLFDFTLQGPGGAGNVPQVSVSALTPSSKPTIPLVGVTIFGDLVTNGPSQFQMDDIYVQHNLTNTSPISTMPTQGAKIFVGGQATSTNAFNARIAQAAVNVGTTWSAT